MAGLSMDIASMVCEEVYQMGTRLDLLSLSETSLVWNGAVRPWLYRSVTLELHSTKTLGAARLVKSLLDPSDPRSTFRSYVRYLAISTRAFEDHRGQHRLQPNVLRALTQLVQLLPNLRSFNWAVHQPMSRALITVLRSHPCLAQRTALVTIRGSKEVRDYLDDLSTGLNLSEFAIEYRGRIENRNRIFEITTSNRHIFLNHPHLKALRINYPDGDFENLIRMDPFHTDEGESLPPIESLSLIQYRFDQYRSTLARRLDTTNLKVLTLTQCSRLDKLLPKLGERVQLRELTIHKPVYSLDDVDHQEQDLLQFLLTQRHLEVLDLEHIGLPRSEVPRILEYRAPLALRSLRLHDFEDRLCCTEQMLGFAGATIIRPIKVFKSMHAANIKCIAETCPELTSLSIDLTQLDIKTTSDAIMAVASEFGNLKYLEITTLFNTQAIDPNHRQMTDDRVYHIAFAVWPPTLDTLRLKVETIIGDPTVRGDTGSWLITRDIMTSDLTVVDEVATAKEKKLKAWTQALQPFLTLDLSKRKREGWEKTLEKRVVDAGVKALKTLR